MVGGFYTRGCDVECQTARKSGVVNNRGRLAKSPLVAKHWRKFSYCSASRFVQIRNTGLGDAPGQKFRTRTAVSTRLTEQLAALLSHRLWGEARSFDIQEELSDELGLGDWGCATS